MQTFLPYASYLRSAQVLDRARLGKQRIEARMILEVLCGKKSPWAKHPAVAMWRGYARALAIYGYSVCLEWRHRGYADNQIDYFISFLRKPVDLVMPHWYADETFHLSHRSNLVRKLPSFYAPLWPDVPADLPYVWPRGATDGA